VIRKSMSRDFDISPDAIIHRLNILGIG